MTRDRWNKLFFRIHVFQMQNQCASLSRRKFAITYPFAIHRVSGIIYSSSSFTWSWWFFKIVMYSIRNIHDKCMTRYMTRITKRALAQNLVLQPINFLCPNHPQYHLWKYYRNGLYQNFRYMTIHDKMHDKMLLSCMLSCIGSFDTNHFCNIFTNDTADDLDTKNW